MFCREAEVSPAASEEDIILADPVARRRQVDLKRSRVSPFGYYTSKYNNSGDEEKYDEGRERNLGPIEQSRQERDETCWRRLTADYVITSGDLSPRRPFPEDVPTTTTVARNHTGKGQLVANRELTALTLTLVLAVSPWQPSLQRALLSCVLICSRCVYSKRGRSAARAKEREKTQSQIIYTWRSATPVLLVRAQLALTQY